MLRDRVFQHPQPPKRLPYLNAWHNHVYLRRIPPPGAIPKSQDLRRRRLPTYPGSAEALSMLTLRPVFTTPVPRHHVEPRAADGALVVHDRATSEQFVVYSPRFDYQFRAGHHAGLWYLRPARDVGATPRSTGFRTAQAAVEAIRGGVWKLQERKGALHRRGTSAPHSITTPTRMRPDPPIPRALGIALLFLKLVIGFEQVTKTPHLEIRHGSKAGHTSGVAGVNARRATPPDPRLRLGARWLSPARPSHPGLVTWEDA